MRRRNLVFGVALIASLPLAGSASAAFEIGDPIVAHESSNCGGTTWVQASSPNDSYAAPSPGVVTSWTFAASYAEAPAQLRFKIARPLPEPNTYEIVGSGELENVGAGDVNTYPIRLPAQTGDVIGIYVPGAVTLACGRGGQPAYGYAGFNGDPAVGPTPLAANLHASSFQIAVSASLEPDGDGDGFGDDTQDGCASDPATQGACDTTAPETTIDKGPKAKSAKKNVKFKFTADEAGATFECKLDRGKFKTCGSPAKFKVKPGKHKFSVRALDSRGNADATPAKLKWKVLKG